MNLAAADAVIGCWHSKYLWNFWRPVTAIREASSDGNPATVGDPAWLPLFDPSTPQFGPPLTTPAFPDHPSGHGCASGAVLESLERFFGSDRVPLTITSDRTRTTRHFRRLSDALEEIVDARVWAGVHFRTADEDGSGGSAARRALRWVDRPPRLPARCRLGSACRPAGARPRIPGRLETSSARRHAAVFWASGSGTRMAFASSWVVNGLLEGRDQGGGVGAGPVSSMRSSRTSVRRRSPGSRR